MRLLVLGALLGVLSVACGHVASPTDEPDGQSDSGSGGDGTDGATGGQGTGGAATGGGSGGTGGSGGSGGTGGGTGGQTSLPGDPFAGDWGDIAVLPSADTLNGNALYVAVDDDGRVFLAGATRSPEVLGGALPEGKTGVSFVLGLDVDGSPLFRRAFPDCGMIVELVLDGDGAPWFTCTVIADSSSVGDSFYGDATFVAQLNPLTGETLREATLESGEETFYVQGLGIDSTGVAYVAGSQRAAVFSEVTVLYSLDLDGHFSVVWSTTGPADEDFVAYPNDVAVLGSDAPVVIGSFHPSMTSGSVTIESTAHYEAYTTYNGFLGLPGAATPLQRFGGATFDLGMAVEALDGGGFALAGSVEGDGDVGGMPYEGHLTSGTLIALFDANAAVTEFAVVPVVGGPSDLAISASGHALVTGDFADGSLVWDYNPATNGLTSRGLVTSGAFEPTGLASAPDGSVYVTGKFNGPLTIEGQELGGEYMNLLIHLPAP